jgi:hypothetical protein
MGNAKGRGVINKPVVKPWIEVAPGIRTAG